MSRISRVGDEGSSRRKTITGAKGNKIPGGKKTFSSRFQQAQSQEIHEELDRILGEIQKAGEQLAKEMTWDRFITYRANVRAFLQTVSNQGFQVCGTKGKTRMGNQKVFITVKTVDQKLADIGEEVMKSEQNHLEVLSKMDELRGLLLDLYH